MSKKASDKTKQTAEQPAAQATQKATKPSRTGSGLIVVGLLFVVVAVSIAGVYLLTSPNSPLTQVINDTFQDTDIQLKDDSAKSVVARTELGRKQNAHIEIIDQEASDQAQKNTDEETIKSARVAVSSLSPTAILAAEAQQKLIATVSQLEGEVRHLQTALQAAQSDINNLQASPNQLPYMRQQLNMLALEQAMLRGKNSDYIYQQISQMIQNLPPSAPRAALVALAEHIENGYISPYQIMATSMDIAQLQAPKPPKQTTEAKTLWQKIKQFFANLVAIDVKSDAQKQADKQWQTAKDALVLSLRTMAADKAQEQLATAPLKGDSRLEALRQTLAAYSHQQALIERAQKRIHTPQPTTIKEVQ